MTDRTQQKTSPIVDNESVAEELVRLRDENAILIATIRDLTHAQLIGRDLELGLRAQVMQCEIDLIHAHAVGRAEVNKVRRSTTWRVGRVITKPLAVVRRIGRLGK